MAADREWSSPGLFHHNACRSPSVKYAWVRCKTQIKQKHTMKGCDHYTVRQTHQIPDDYPMLLLLDLSLC